MRNVHIIDDVSELTQQPPNVVGPNSAGWSVLVDLWNVSLNDSDFTNRPPEGWRNAPQTEICEGVFGLLDGEFDTGWADAKVIVNPKSSTLPLLITQTIETSGGPRTLPAIDLQPGRAFYLHDGERTHVSSTGNAPQPYVTIDVSALNSQWFVGDRVVTFRSMYEVEQQQLDDLQAAWRQPTPQPVIRVVDPAPKAEKLVSPNATQDMAALREQRLNQIFSDDGLTVIIPLDDVVIDGSIGRLRRLSETIDMILEGGPNAVLGMLGTFQRPDYAAQLAGIPKISNLTVSTSMGLNLNPPNGVALLDKRLYGKPKLTVAQSLDAGAVMASGHVNYGSPTEGKQLANFGKIVTHAQRVGMPVLQHGYFRSLNNEDTIDFHFGDGNTFLNAQLGIIGAAGNGGADVIKVNWPGSKRYFQQMVEAADGRRLVIAGGPLESIEVTLYKAAAAVEAGGHGVACARNMLGLDNDPTSAIKALVAVTHDRMPPDRAMREFDLTSTGLAPAIPFEI